MREAYLALADRYRAELAQALTLLGDAEPPAAIHCAGGRDRTGIACGMALWLAGVEPDAIAADHALSDESWAPHNQEWLAQASDELERERRLRVSQPAGRTLVDVLEEIERAGGHTQSAGRRRRRRDRARPARGAAPGRGLTQLC